jgi:hypothetical protein
MGFKEVQALDTDVVIALGGRDKKTGKANPTKVEGYYLGSKKVESKLARTGFAYIYVFQTPKGNIGVWGKTDLDRKMTGVALGAMTRVTQAGTIATPKGDMYKYKVEIDGDNTIEVNVASESSIETSDGGSDDSTESLFGTDDDAEETDAGEEEEALDEVIPQRAAAPKQPAATPDAVRQAKVKALLAGNRNKSAS